MKYIKNIFITFSTQIITVILGVVTAIVIAKVLGPEGKGSYTLIILVPTLLATLGSLGIGIANVYFGGSLKYDWADLASNSVISALGLGVILSVAFIIYYHLFHPSFLPDTDPLYLSLAVLILPLSLLTKYFSYILLGQKRIKEFNLVSLARGGTYLILLIFVLLLLKGGISSAILAWVGATLVATILSILLVRRETNIIWSFQPSLLKDSVKFGVKGYLVNVINLLNYRLDMFMVAFFMNVTFVGYYSISVALAETLWYFPAAVGAVIFAHTPGLSTGEANTSTPRICRNTFFIIIIAALILFALSRYIIILLFGSAFLPALRSLWILLPGVVVFSIAKVLGNEMTGRGKPIINAIASATSLGINIPMNIVLIPMWGISGAAFASTVSYAVGAVVTLIVFMRISKNSLFDTVIIKREDFRLYAVALSSGCSLALKGSKNPPLNLKSSLWIRMVKTILNPFTSSKHDPLEQQGREAKSEERED